MRNVYRVGDWDGQQEEHLYWSDDKLKKGYEHSKNTLKRSIDYVRKNGWDDTFVECGATNPTSDLQTVKQFKKEIIKRMSLKQNEMRNT
tara:strand:- start:37 stop:303 length:267 start_codon:yes stop_codon:yes gene_type:complete